MTNKIIKKPKKVVLTYAQLASRVAKTEGRRIQVSIGNVREVQSIFSDLIFDATTGPHVIALLWENGRRRSVRRLKEARRRRSVKPKARR